MSGSTWTTRIVPLSDVAPSDLDRWRALADRAIEPNAYLDPRFLGPAGRRSDAVDIRVAFVERGDALQAVHQFTVDRLAVGWPVRVATSGGAFMTTHADRHTPLVGDDDPVGAIDALLRGLRRPGTPGLTLFRRFPADGAFAQALAEALSRGRRLALERLRQAAAFAAGGRSHSDEIFDMSALSTSRAKAYRRRARGVERDAGAPLRLVDRRDDAEVAEFFLDFQASGWKGDPERGGGAFRLDAEHEAWYRAVVGGFAADGDLLAPALMAGDETVFLALDVRSGGAGFGFIDAYNERFAAHGPGALGRLAEWSHILSTGDVAHFDPAFDPFYQESAKLYPDRRDILDVLVGDGTFGRLIVRVLPAARSLRDRLRPAACTEGPSRTGDATGMGDAAGSHTSAASP